ncbi:SRPBCC family protein [Microlunatus flavus]|uniref:Polyketide cyclase / dehydrase and lipid transport n=1 Tax=Microlunatus flavus TaxID=1036181 RepID=A0A1H8ZDQ0_9ACTN|nr:SRPBCC family protein [Microlunatus flavus]SEP62560.1 Polyketide cyclase / dehydrase and lipid transport [Microlunatus flavus]
MSTVKSSVEVDVPVSTAYNQWTQFESFPQFMDGVESITQATETSNHWKVKVGGVEREFDTQITEQTPDQVIAWSSTGGDTGGHSGRVLFTSLGASRTKVDVELGWEPEGIVEKAGAALGFDQRQVDSSTRDFKTFIESRGTSTGEWRGDVSGGSAH